MENTNTEKQKSLLEIACDIMAREQTSLPIKKVIKEALVSKGIAEDDEKAMIRLYSEIINSSKFVYMGEGNWDLKDREPLSQYDLDGSAFYVPVIEEEVEEVEKVSRANDANDFTVSEKEAKELEEKVGSSNAGLADSTDDDDFESVDSDELVDLIEDEEIDEDEFDYSSIYDDDSDDAKEKNYDLDKYDDYIDYEDGFEK